MQLAAFFSKLLKPSTVAFWKEAQARPTASLWETLHGLLYLKWPELYISIGLQRNRAGRLIAGPAYRLGRVLGFWRDDAGGHFADTYHGKALPLPEASRLIRIGKSVRMELPEKVLPYAMARAIILDNPSALALFRCPCRAMVKNPCLPLDVCIIVGRPIVDFVLEHHAGKARRISVDEAVDVVRQAQMRGNVSHAFFKEAVLGRYYAICNCCSCCCGAMQAHRQGTPMLASSGYCAELSPEHCVACGKCAAICPFSAIDLPSARQHGGKRKSLPVIDTARCMGCGVCALHCPQEALSLKRDFSKPEPLPVTAPISDHATPS